MPSCNDCYYYSVEKQQKCRRFPPPNSAGGWPTVQPTDLCGEHRYGAAGTTIGATIAANEAKAAASKVTETKFEPVPVPPPPPQTKPVPATVTPASTFPVRQPASKINIEEMSEKVKSPDTTKPLATKHDEPATHKKPSTPHKPHHSKPKSHHR